jgi:hypothetical protein
MKMTWLFLKYKIFNVHKNSIYSNSAKKYDEARPGLEFSLLIFKRTHGPFTVHPVHQRLVYARTIYSYYLPKEKSEGLRTLRKR